MAGFIAGSVIGGPVAGLVGTTISALLPRKTCYIDMVIKALK